jgi:hypothetical protein
MKIKQVAPQLYFLVGTYVERRIVVARTANLVPMRIALAGPRATTRKAQ